MLSWFQKEVNRAYLYRVGVAMQPLAVAYGLSDNRGMALVISLLAAVLGNGLAFINTSNVRQYLYGILGAAAALAAYLGVFTEAEAALWLAVGAAVIGNVVASVNTSMTDEK